MQHAGFQGLWANGRAVRVCGRGERGPARPSRPPFRAKHGATDLRLSITSVPRLRLSITSVPRLRLSFTSVPRLRLSFTSVPRLRLSITSVPRLRLSFTSVPGLRLSITSVPRLRLSFTSVPRLRLSITVRCGQIWRRMLHRPDDVTSGCCQVPCASCAWNYSHSTSTSSAMDGVWRSRHRATGLLDSSSRRKAHSSRRQPAGAPSLPLPLAPSIAQALPSAGRAAVIVGPSEGNVCDGQG